MTQTYLDRTAQAENVANVLHREGAVVMKDLIEPEQVDTIAAELSPQLDANGLKSRSIFNGTLLTATAT